MFKRMLVLSLLGVVVVGGAVALWGAPAGAGPLSALAALVSGGDHDDDDDHDRRYAYEAREGHDDDDD